MNILKIIAVLFLIISLYITHSLIEIQKDVTTINYMLYNEIRDQRELRNH